MTRAPVLRRLFAEFGSISEYARALGLTRQAVQQWRQVPEEYLARMAVMTDLSYHDLRPDLYDREGRRRDPLAGAQGRRGERVSAE